MKTILILTLGALCLGSCSKNWKCTVTNNGVEAATSYDFRGTTEEKNQHEEDGTNTYTVGNLTFDQSIKCVND